MVKNTQIKFAIVGFWNTLFAWIVFVTIQLLFVPPLTNLKSVLVTYVVSVVNSYGMQRVFVWGSKSQVASEFLKFVLVTFCQLSLNLLLMHFFVDLRGFAPIPSQLLISIFLICLTYLVMKNWTFKNRTKYGLR